MADTDDRAVPLLDTEEFEAPARVKQRYTLPEPKTFALKCLFIFAATYAFIPLIAAHQRGEVTATVYAALLVTIHVLFIVIYFYRVKLRALDSNWRSLTARVVGLLSCVYLLYLVAGHLPTGLGVLALDLLGLCAVHTLILALLSVRVGEAEAKAPPATSA